MDNIDSFNSSQSPNRNVIRVFSAVIEEIFRDRNATFVTIAYDNNRSRSLVRLVVNQETAIYDERGRNIRAAELARGMTVDASFSSAMTRSNPPQAQAFFIRVTGRASRSVTTIGRIAEVNNRNDFILVLRDQNPSSIIRFNISDNTVILDPFGRRTPLSSLRPGFRVRVEHATFMTTSIPPQTNAFIVRVIR